MDEASLVQYVDAACKAQELALTPEQRQSVIAQFARIAAIAQPVIDFPLGPEDEQAPQFRP